MNISEAWVTGKFGTGIALNGNSRRLAMLGCGTFQVVPSKRFYLCPVDQASEPHNSGFWTSSNFWTLQHIFFRLAIFLLVEMIIPTLELVCLLAPMVLWFLSMVETTLELTLLFNKFRHFLASCCCDL